MEALIYDRDMETVSDWQLFGGQLHDLSVQSTFADLQGQVLQTSWPNDLAGDFLEDSSWSYPVDVTAAKHPSLSTVEEIPSLCDDDLYDVLSSSPEEAFLRADDDDSAVVSVASTVDNSLSVIFPSNDGGPDLSGSKFNYGNVLSSQQCLISNVPKNFYDNQKIHFQLPHIAVDKPPRIDSFAFEHGNASYGLHYENHYKPAAELDGIECAYDSLLDADSVCQILNQLVDNKSYPHSGRPILLSVSPEEVESVLSGNSAPVADLDYESVVVPCSSPVSNVGFLQFTAIDVSSTALLSTEYSQDCLSPISSTSHSYSSSSPGVPYSVETRVDRKLKKKEQNKTAALRYRNKKREEKGVTYSEVEELEQKNAKLQARADDLTKEINYLKSLLEEIKRQ